MNLAVCADWIQHRILDRAKNTNSCNNNAATHWHWFVWENVTSAFSAWRVIYVVMFHTGVYCQTWKIQLKTKKTLSRFLFKATGCNFKLVIKQCQYQISLRSTQLNWLPVACLTACPVCQSSVTCICTISVTGSKRAPLLHRACVHVTLTQVTHSCGRHSFIYQSCFRKKQG